MYADEGGAGIFESRDGRQDPTDHNGSFHLQQPKSVGSKQGASRASTGRPLGARLREPIVVSALQLHLLLISFGTGLLDAETYSDFGIFASNQTGNTIIVLVEAVDRSSRTPAPLAAVGVSLASFLFFGVLFGQIGVSRFVGPRTRGWLALSTLLQATLLLVTAVLVQVGVLQPVRSSSKDASLIMLLLASSSGIQVAMAKSIGVSEVPTAMLTSPYMDLLTDPHLSECSVSSSRVRSRNLRLAYLVLFAGGTVVGAALRAHSGTTTVLWLSLGLRLGNFAFIGLAPRTKDKP